LGLHVAFVGDSWGGYFVGCLVQHAAQRPEVSQTTGMPAQRGDCHLLLTDEHYEWPVQIAANDTMLQTAISRAVRTDSGNLLAGTRRTKYKGRRYISPSRTPGANGRRPSMQTQCDCVTFKKWSMFPARESGDKQDKHKDDFTHGYELIRPVTSRRHHQGNSAKLTGASLHVLGL